MKDHEKLVSAIVAGSFARTKQIEGRIMKVILPALESIANELAAERRLLEQTDALMRAREVDWGAVDGELLSILGTGLITAGGSARDQAIINELRALLRKVSGQ
jgi:hypothetical protein